MSEMIISGREPPKGDLNCFIVGIFNIGFKNSFVLLNSVKYLKDYFLYQACCVNNACHDFIPCYKATLDARSGP